MTRRSGAEVDRVLTMLGTDLALDYPARPATRRTPTSRSRPRPASCRSCSTSESPIGCRAADQLLVNRLKTQKGELAALGHPEYGSRHPS